MAIFILACDDDAEADSLFTLELDVVTDADRVITINVVTDADGSISISAPCSPMDSSPSVLLEADANRSTASAVKAQSSYR